MCGQETVKAMIQLGKKLEKKDPNAAAREYLQAAELLITLSKDQGQQQEYMELADRIYKKAVLLRSQPAQPNFVAAPGEISFASIGGLADLKDEIRLKIIEPLKNPDVFKHYGKQIGGGILMYGPPGCGKSLIARATAHEAGVSFIHVKTSDIKSKYVGETEKNIAELFSQARKKQPAIIFFDEFEVLGGNRTNASPHERSAVAQLLTEMDGMDSKDQEILLLAATNEPWNIDPAIRREGRFGTSIFIPPPDFDARRQILQLHLQGRPLGKVDYDALAQMTEGYSGADLKSVCERATDIPLKESLRTGKRRTITQQDLHTVAEDIQSVLPQWFSIAREQITNNNLQDTFHHVMEAS